MKHVHARRILRHFTGFREDARWHVIESLASSGAPVADGPHACGLSSAPECGAVNDHHMDTSVWQRRRFERASLEYLDATASQRTIDAGPWNTSVTVSQ